MIGVLQAGMLDSAYSLTEVRVLYELAHAEPMETGELRGLLGLDAGYLSRILSRLEGDGLLSRERSPGDARKQVIRLSEAGVAMYRRLDARSAEEIEQLLAGLAEADQESLVTSMAAIRKLLGEAPEREPFVIRAPRSGDLGWAVQLHAEIYNREYGWGVEFEQLVARLIGGLDFSGRDAGWIAEAGGERLGCVFFEHVDADTAKLRMLLVGPSARGLGLGRRLVEECVRHARDGSYKRITLWTRECLESARRIYARAGFVHESSEKSVENGIEVVDEIWTLGL
ncbi:bifunctional helix-turn-helix transcriptional regulator/GNAT family N-acetyltransferase [Nonomuraea sp. NPDC050691]|uniref:bifunctional helix-turn-helix transcriptional regulator/GNAT family N-acetyltransferase n=1 Tax=Nonomuraea sp. NPDC050691 TaxID=3155661 RepID=UPI0033FF25CA